MTARAAPPGWPPDIAYLCLSSEASDGLPVSLRSRYCSPVEDADSPFHPARYKSIQIEIRRIDERTPFFARPFGSSSSGRHPALGQYGLFALQDIPPRTFIRPYFGRVHTDEEADPHSEYDMKVEHLEPQSSHSVSGSIAIDATERGNEARFANDYRSVMPRNNCELDTWSANRGTKTECVGMGIFSGSKPIRAGTELTVNYGKGFWSRYAETAEADSPAPNGEVGKAPSDVEQTLSAEPPTRSADTLVTVQALLARQRSRLATAKTRPAGH